MFLITTSLLIFNDHTWFNPDEMDPPAWHEIFRRLAGPITALPVCLIALPADWGTERLACGASYFVDASRGRGLANIRH